MTKSESEDSSKQLLTSTNNLPVTNIITVEKIVGLYAISENTLKQLNKLDSEVPLNTQRLYLVIETSFLGRNCLFATPFRTNIPKNQNPYTSLPKMSGTGNTRKGCTHGLHLAKTIPVTKKALINSRHSKAYKPLMKDGTFFGLIGDIKNWVNRFEGNEIAEDYTPYYYSVKLKMLVKAVNS